MPSVIHASIAGLKMESLPVFYRLLFLLKEKITKSSRPTRTSRVRPCPRHLPCSVGFIFIGSRYTASRSRSGFLAGARPDEPIRAGTSCILSRTYRCGFKLTNRQKVTEYDETVCQCYLTTSLTKITGAILV